MTDSHIYDAIIIGAGISGLSLAFRLKQAGLSILVLEASDIVGGVMQSRTLKTPFGFATVEMGPNTVPSSAAEFLALTSDVGLTPTYSSDSAKNRYLFLNGKLQPLPGNPISFLTSPILSLFGKLRILQDLYKPVQSEQEISIAQFMEARFGKELLDNLITPALTGIYAGDPSQMSLQATFSFLAEWEQNSGSVIKGAMKALKKRKESLNKNHGANSNKASKHQLISFKDGMSTLPKAIANMLGDDIIQTRQTVSNIERLEQGTLWYRINTTSQSFLCNQLIIATAADAAAKLLSPLQSDVSRLLEIIPYAAMNLVFFGFEKARLKKTWDGFGFLVPRKQSQKPYIKLLGSIWNSSLFPDRYPSSLAFSTQFQGGMFHPEINNLSDEALTALTLDELRIAYQQPELVPVYSHIKRWPKAIPQYTLEHQARLEQIDSLLKEALPQLYLLGNYQHGVSLNDCVKNANALASQLIASKQSN